MGWFFFLEVTIGFEPMDNGVADRGLTTWLRHLITVAPFRLDYINKESLFRKGRCIKRFPLPLLDSMITESNGHDFIRARLFWSGLRGSNPPPRPWQGRALPNELNPQLWCLRSESNQRHEDFQSSALPTELQRHTALAVFCWRPEGDSNP